jgi:hypothetical protein
MIAESKQTHIFQILIWRRGRGANDTGRGGFGRTFTPRNPEYQSGYDSRYRRDRWDSAPYQFTRGGNRGGRGRGRGGYF